jgi:hypothetical protein
MPVAGRALHASPSAKRRSRRRARSAGAAMFVVAMCVTVLASVGIYALAAAANEIATSGNERQNTQTHYLADYGVQATAHAVAGGTAQIYFNIMTIPAPSPSGGSASLPSCASVPIPYGATPPQASLACAQLRSADLAQSWTQPQATLTYGTSTGMVPYASGIAPGSFGLTPLAGDFFVELTDPEKAPAMVGFDQNSPLCVIQFTATVMGFTQPLSSTGVVSYESEGLEMQRARVMGGPITCPKWGQGAK